MLCNKYEEWDFASTVPIYQWFKQTKAYSKKGDDYSEDLFSAMNQVIDGWNNHYTHPMSVRVMIILGDAGDHGRNSGMMEKVITKLKENIILPIAIQFQHSHRKPNDAGIEQEAMDAFVNQLSQINQSIYTIPQLQKVQSIPKKAFAGNLEQYVISVSNTIVELVVPYK